MTSEEDKEKKKEKKERKEKKRNKKKSSSYECVNVCLVEQRNDAFSFSPPFRTLNIYHPFTSLICILLFFFFVFFLFFLFSSHLHSPPPAHTHLALTHAKQGSHLSFPSLSIVHSLLSSCQPGNPPSIKNEKPETKIRNMESQDRPRQANQRPRSA